MGEPKTGPRSVFLQEKKEARLQSRQSEHTQVFQLATFHDALTHLKCESLVLSVSGAHA